MKQYFDYDNGEFTQWLEAKGFFVAPKSTSNYPSTHLSIASSLNMKYLNTLIDSLDKEASDDRMLKDIISENQISKVLKQFGYQTVVVSSGAYTEITADYYVDTLSIKEIHFLILNMTPLPWLENNLLRRIPFYKPVFDPFAHHRLRTLNMFDSVQSIKTINGPKFVFIHMLVPRWPFVFGENGEAVIPKKGFFSFLEGEKEDYQKRYRAQLIFVNKKVKDMVNEILDLPGKKPIIIIQGDHGSDSVLDWQKKPNEEGLRERFPILNAYLLPDGTAQLLYETITPVNTFRVVLNTYFGLEWQLLEDKNYYRPVGKRIDLVDVTDVIVQ